LVVIDQLPPNKLKQHAARYPFVRSATSLSLGYIPRTTPVGHATISTGSLPSRHRIQGRTWFSNNSGGLLVEHDVETLAAGTFDPGLHVWLQSHSLAAAVRARRPDAGIVVAAAKAFIPFVLGAESADLAVYPLDVKPGDVRGRGDLRVVVRIEAFTQQGRACLQNETAAIVRAFEALLRGIDPAGDYEWFPPESMNGTGDPDSREAATMELAWETALSAPSTTRCRFWRLVRGRDHVRRAYMSSPLGFSR
jgi:hypothetical protein